jgi:ribosomal protein S18 acetylase RimI-like enzyme
MSVQIRPCRRHDLSAVAELFTRLFLKQRHVQDALRDYLERLIFSDLPLAEDAPSLVCVSGGNSVCGFVGAWPRRLHLNGIELNAAVVGSLMVDPEVQRQQIGTRLLTEVINGPYDFIYSETANTNSQRIWAKIGAKRLPELSLDWLRIFQPARFGLEVASRTIRSIALLGPAAGLADRFAAPWFDNAYGAKPQPASCVDVEADDEQLAAAIPVLGSHYGLRPDWHSPPLLKLLDHAVQKPCYGSAHRRLVYRGDKTNAEPVGCFIYHGKRGGVARVLQNLALPGCAGYVLDRLLLHAREAGCTAIRGRIVPDFFDDVVQQRCVMFQVSATVIYSADQRLMDELARAETLLSGLAGETWMQLIGNDFLERGKVT